MTSSPVSTAPPLWGAILQVGHFYFDDPGQFFIGANKVSD